jgi:hypothetical protein
MKIECTIQELIELIENKKETPVVFTTGAKKRIVKPVDNAKFIDDILESITAY